MRRLGDRLVRVVKVIGLVREVKVDLVCNAGKGG